MPPSINFQLRAIFFFWAQLVGSKVNRSNFNSLLPDYFPALKARDTRLYYSTVMYVRTQILAERGTGNQPALPNRVHVSLVYT